jgi:hypothetical protein
MNKERDANQWEAFMWLMKRSDEQSSGNQVVLRQGGENISSTPCIRHKLLEDFPFLSSLFLFLSM